MSLDPRYVGLMHAEIDQVISPEGRADLRAYLDSHPAARQHFLELCRLSQTLARVGEVDPPAGLKERVLRAVRASAAVASVAREQPHPPAAARRFRPDARAALRYGYALAAGIILGLVIRGWPHASPPRAGVESLDPSVLVGTMARQQQFPVNPILQEFTVALPGGEGKVALRRAEPGHTIEFDLPSREPVRVSLEYDSGRLEFRGFAQDSQAADSLEARGSRLSWTQSGEGRLAVLLTPRDAGATTLEVELFSSGVVVGSGSFELTETGQDRP